MDEDAEVRGGLGADVEVFHFGAVVGVCWCEVRVGRVLLVLRVEEAKMTRDAVTICRDTPVVLYKTAQGSDGTDLRETRGPETYPLKALATAAELWRPGGAVAAVQTLTGGR